MKKKSPPAPQGKETPSKAHGKDCARRVHDLADCTCFKSEPCGCYGNCGGCDAILCPLHASAPALLEALEDAMATLTRWQESSEWDKRDSLTYANIEAAIRAAKGKP